MPLAFYYCWMERDAQLCPESSLEPHRYDLLLASSFHQADGALLLSGHCCSQEGNDVHHRTELFLRSSLG